METEQKEVKTNQEIEETDWIKAELEETKEQNFDGEKLPAWKFEQENKIYSFTIDFSNKFQTYLRKEDGSVAKIIPLIYEGTRFIWWLNPKNPVYSQILKKFDEAKSPEFRIMRTGQQQNTRYTIVEE